MKKRWGKMRTIKVSHAAFADAVKNKSRNCKFMPIPSSNKKFVYTGLLMPAGVWVAWPDNLTEEELNKYIDTYGNIPDLFTPKPESSKLTYVPRGVNEED